MSHSLPLPLLNDDDLLDCQRRFSNDFLLFLPFLWTKGKRVKGHKLDCIFPPPRSHTKFLCVVSFVVVVVVVVLSRKSHRLSRPVLCFILSFLYRFVLLSDVFSATKSIIVLLLLLRRCIVIQACFCTLFVTVLQTWPFSFLSFRVSDDDFLPFVKTEKSITLRIIYHVGPIKVFLDNKRERLSLSCVSVHHKSHRETALCEREKWKSSLRQKKHETRQLSCLSPLENVPSSVARKESRLPNTSPTI